MQTRFLFFFLKINSLLYDERSADPPASPTLIVPVLAVGFIQFLFIPPVVVEGIVGVVVVGAGAPALVDPDSYRDAETLVIVAVIIECIVTAAVSAACILIPVIACVAGRGIIIHVIAALAVHTLIVATVGRIILVFAQVAQLISQCTAVELVAVVAIMGVVAAVVVEPPVPFVGTAIVSACFSPVVEWIVLRFITAIVAARFGAAIAIPVIIGIAAATAGLFSFGSPGRRIP